MELLSYRMKKTFMVGKVSLGSNARNIIYYTQTFLSSRYMDTINNEPCVNVPFRPSAMNEVTMRSVLATHSTGIPWQSLHRIATVFDMITPLQTMLSRYVTRLEEATEKAVKSSMIEAANELHQRVDYVISPDPGAINITVSFDSS